MELETQIDILNKKKLALDTDISILDDDTVKQKIAEVKSELNLNDIPIDEKTEIENVEEMIRKIEASTDINVIMKDDDIINMYNKNQSKKNAIIDQETTKKIYMDELDRMVASIKAKSKSMVDGLPLGMANAFNNSANAGIFYNQIKNIPIIMRSIDNMINFIPDETGIIKNTIDNMETPAGASTTLKTGIYTGKNAVNAPHFKITTPQNVQYKYNELGIHIAELTRLLEINLNGPTQTTFVTVRALAPTPRTYTTLKTFFDNIVDKIKTDATPIIDTYIKNRITGNKMTGGGLFDYVVIPLRRHLLRLYYNSYSLLLTSTINKLTDDLKKLEAENIIPPTIDYVTPLKALLQYRIGSPTDIDIQLITYCLSIGLSQDVALSIYFAEKKSDIVALLNINKIAYRAVLMNILRLKKLSAYKKFLRDYQVQESQLGLLYSHRRSYF